MNKEQRLEFVEGSPWRDVLEAMESWGYPTSDTPPNEDPGNWWAGFVTPNGIVYGSGDSPEEAVRQAAILIIKQEIQ